MSSEVGDNNVISSGTGVEHPALVVVCSMHGEGLDQQFQLWEWPCYGGHSHLASHVRDHLSEYGMADGETETCRFTVGRL